MSLTEMARVLGLPRETLRDRALREDWASRVRSGRGGGRLYALSGLPPALREALLSLRLLRLPTVLLIRPLGECPAQRAEGLTDGQRDVMEARAQILNWIDERLFLFNKKEIIEALLRLVREDRLPSDLRSLILRANAKSGQRSSKGPARAGLSRGTIFLWYRLRKEGGVPALAPQLTRETDLAIPDWVPGFLALYQRPSKPSLAATLEDYRSSLSDPALAPSYDQVRRFVKKLSVLETNRGRMGTEALKRFKAFTRRDISELWPAACYTADGHCFKAKVLHPFHGQPFRPELTAILDIFTGYVTGWHAGLSENALDVLYALSDAMIERGDGRHKGIGAIFYTDNGPGFKNRLMNDPLTGFCARCRIETPKSIAYNSQARGKIEVLNKSLWIRAARKLESYCGQGCRQAAFTRTGAVHPRGEQGRQALQPLLKLGRVSGSLSGAD